MTENEVFNFLYSSSATVYGDPQKLPLTEDHPTGNCTNPYGKSKYFTEEILKDLCAADSVSNHSIQVKAQKLKIFFLVLFSAGMSFHCVTSIRWEPMKAGELEKILLVSPIT
jgi:dTDP-4-dehydrorhamnose reductase